MRYDIVFITSCMFPEFLHNFFIDWTMQPFEEMTPTLKNNILPEIHLVCSHVVEVDTQFLENIQLLNWKIAENSRLQVEDVVIIHGGSHSLFCPVEVFDGQR